MFRSGCPVEIKITSRQDLLKDLDFLLSDKLPAMILISENRVKAFGMEGLMDRWKSEYSILHYAHILPNPSVTSVADAIRAAKAFCPRRIIAFGGGSSIDMAKAISALLPVMRDDISAEAVRSAILQKSYLSVPAACEITAVPTTAGSGSEVTHWATVWDPDRCLKYSVDKDDLYPRTAFLSAELQALMPPRLTLTTGLDALSHAMEAFWSRARNPESQLRAVSAVTGIALTLPKLLKSPDDLKLRGEMLRSVLSAGLAFSATRTTACHSISYPLTMRRGIEHGFACALTLYPVAVRNLAEVPQIEQLLEPFGGLSGFRTWLEEVTEGIQPLKLSAWNVPEEDLSVIAKDAFTRGRMDNNPVPFTETDVLEILREVF